MRIAVCSCVHRRTETTKKFLDSLLRLIEYSALQDIHIKAHIAVTEDDKFFDVLKKHHVAPYVTAYPFSNYNLGSKWNYALSKCYASDYIFITGSDDIYSRNYITAFKPYLDKGFDYMGVLDFYFYDALKRSSHYFSGYAADRKGEPKGAGRIIKTSIIEKKAWAMWPTAASKGLDAHFTQKIYGMRLKTKFVRMSELDICAVDIKTQENIHPVREYNTLDADTKILMEMINK